MCEEGNESIGWGGLTRARVKSWVSGGQVVKGEEFLAWATMADHIDFAVFRNLHLFMDVNLLAASNLPPSVSHRETGISAISATAIASSLVSLTQLELLDIECVPIAPQSTTTISRDTGI